MSEASAPLLPSCDTAPALPLLPRGNTVPLIDVAAATPPAKRSKLEGHPMQALSDVDAAEKADLYTPHHEGQFSPCLQHFRRLSDKHPRRATGNVLCVHAVAVVSHAYKVGSKAGSGAVAQLSLRRDSHLALQ